MQKVRITRETDEDAEHRKESFKKIFDKNIWGKENPSGGGSSLTGKVSFNSSRDATGSFSIRGKELFSCFYNMKMKYFLKRFRFGFGPIANFQ